MNIFGIGIPEIAVIAVLALLIFGPKRLPQLGKTIGKTLKGLQTASKEFENEINKISFKHGIIGIIWRIINLSIIITPICIVVSSFTFFIYVF